MLSLAQRMALQAYATTSQTSSSKAKKSKTIETSDSDSSVSSKASRSKVKKLKSPAKRVCCFTIIYCFNPPPPFPARQHNFPSVDARFAVTIFRISIRINRHDLRMVLGLGSGLGLRSGF
jgi:hypothetical protein